MSPADVRKWRNTTAPNETNPQKHQFFCGFADDFASLPRLKMNDEGLEEGPQTPNKQAFSETGGAQSGAIRSDAILKELSDCWPHLPNHVRQTIMTLPEESLTEVPRQQGTRQ